MAVPNADTLDAKSLQEIKECGETFGSNTVGSCSGKALMRAMTNSMDTMTGRLMETVDKLDPNTYIIHLGNNGTWMFGPKREFIDNMYITQKGRGKGTAYESGALVPMTVRGPNIKADFQSNESMYRYVDLGNQNHKDCSESTCSCAYTLMKFASHHRFSTS